MSVFSRWMRVWVAKVSSTFEPVGLSAGHRIAASHPRASQSTCAHKEEPTEEGVDGVLDSDGACRRMAESQQVEEQGREVGTVKAKDGAGGGEKKASRGGEIKNECKSENKIERDSASRRESRRAEEQKSRRAEER
eukprot:3640498-Rhodomonas_salina.6